MLGKKRLDSMLTRVATDTFDNLAANNRAERIMAKEIQNRSEFLREQINLAEAPNPHQTTSPKTLSSSHSRILRYNNPQRNWTALLRSIVSCREARGSSCWSK